MLISGGYNRKSYYLQTIHLTWLRGVVPSDPDLSTWTLHELSESSGKSPQVRQPNCKGNLITHLGVDSGNRERNDIFRIFWHILSGTDVTCQNVASEAFISIPFITSKKRMYGVSTMMCCRLQKPRDPARGGWIPVLAGFRSRKSSWMSTSARFEISGLFLSIILNLGRLT